MNDMTQWTEKMVAHLDVDVEDYYNHTKVTGDDLMDALWIIRKNSPQEIETDMKDVDTASVKVPGSQ